MRYERIGAIALALCLWGCGGGSGNGVARSSGQLGVFLEDVSTNPSSLVSVSFFVNDSDGTPRAELLAGDFQIFEDDEKISIFESAKRISLDARNFTDYTLLLLDLSDSVVRSGSLPDLKTAARALVEILFSGQNTDVHQVAVYWFDGGAEIQNALGNVKFSADVATLEAGIDGLPGSTDRSTNLNGAVVQGFEVLQAALDDASEETITRANLVFFTDGRDNAGRVPAAVAYSTVEFYVGNGTFDPARRMESYSIGLGGEIDANVLRQIGRSGFEPAGNVKALRAAFNRVATRIENRANSFYRLEYCSPKRAGQHVLTIEASADDTVGFLSAGFNADGFTPECPLGGGEIALDVFGGAGSDIGTAVAVGIDGSRYIAGYHDAPLELAAPHLASGSRRGFVAKLPAEGLPREIVWSTALGGETDRVIVKGLSLLDGEADQRDLVAVGHYDGSPTLLNLATSQGGDDAFIARLDGATGDVKWIRSFGGSGADSFRDVSVGASGIFVAGYFESEASSAGSTPVVSAGGRDLYAARWSADGNLVWQFALGGPSLDQGNGIIESPPGQDGAGSLFIVGTIGSDIATPSIISVEFPSALVLKLDADGQTVSWAQAFGNPALHMFSGTSEGVDIEVHNSGDPLVIGNFRGEALRDADGPERDADSLDPANDAFAVRIMADSGIPDWFRAFGGLEDDRVTDLSLNANFDLAIVGLFRGRIKLIDGSYSSQGESDVFVLELSGQSGDGLGSQALGGPGIERGIGIASAGQDSLLIGSYAEGAAFLNESPANKGLDDIFLFRNITDSN